MSDRTIKRALVSLTDKAGIEAFARTLVDEFGVEIVSTGGTHKVLAEAGIPVTAIEDVTGFPEMMDGRVKTLHPKVHGGLLARRDSESHMSDAADYGIEMIDLVVVNLYAFEDTIARAGVTFAEAIENIDIGGPSMLRSAAKNHESVTVVTDPADYDAILSEMREHAGATTLPTRRRLATKVFGLTSAYDNAIFTWLQAQAPEGPESRFPQERRVFLEKIQDLRYGENPHQDGAFYRFSNAAEHTLARAEQLQGKELSYNNIQDADACWTAVREFDEPACVIMKHMNPCGVALAQDVVAAYILAHECDPVSAYGGVMAFNRTVPGDLVQAIFDKKQFVEVMIAPDFEPAALDLIATKKNLRVLRTGGINHPKDSQDMKSVEGGMLIQQSDHVSEDPKNFTVASTRQPTQEELDQLWFAWKVAKSVKSNAILLAKDFVTVGVGAGQMNRVNSARIACEQAGAKAHGAVAASDAFMPFADSLEVCAEAGVTAIIQPGGSIRDEEVIEAANKYGIALVFTGHRHFRH